MSDLNELAARVEAADGPNFALECEIWCALNPDAERRPVPPNYTASLDGALSLVPELLAWHVSSACPRDACAAIESGDDRVQDFKGRAFTPALALTAAALKARAMAGEM